MQGFEFVGHKSIGSVGRIYAHRKDEQGLIGHVAYPVDGITPLAAEITFQAPLGRSRDHRDEVRASRNVAPDLAVIIVPTSSRSMSNQVAMPAASNPALICCTAGRSSPA